MTVDVAPYPLGALDDTHYARLATRADTVNTSPQGVIGHRWMELTAIDRLVVIQVG